MKKISLFLLIVVTGVFASCKEDKQDYTCSCQYNDWLWKRHFATHEIYDATEKEAKSECRDYEEYYGSVNNNTSSTCWLE